MTENPKVDNPETPEETFETIPDHLVSQKSGQFPIMYSTTAEMPGTGAYEDIGQSSSVGNKKSAHYQNAQNNNNDVHGYVNTPTPPKADVEHEANTEEYENVRESKPYEALKRIEYENTKNLEETEVYTGLESSKRHSKV